MASSVSAEKLAIFECSGGTFVTVYAAGRVKSGGITGLTLDSTNGEPKVGCNGELLRGMLAVKTYRNLWCLLWSTQVQAQDCQVLTHSQRRVVRAFHRYHRQQARQSVSF